MYETLNCIEMGYAAVRNLVIIGGHHPVICHGVYFSLVYVEDFDKSNIFCMLTGCGCLQILLLKFEVLKVVFPMLPSGSYNVLSIFVYISF